MMTSLNSLPLGEATVVQAASIEIPDRYELKYLISESKVEAVRRAIAPYCVLDPYSAHAPNHEYGIQSLYLDTEMRDLFRISRERQRSPLEGACPALRRLGHGLPRGQEQGQRHGQKVAREDPCRGLG
jgi:hypothetical protein